MLWNRALWQMEICLKIKVPNKKIKAIVQKILETPSEIGFSYDYWAFDLKKCLEAVYKEGVKNGRKEANKIALERYCGI